MPCISRSREIRFCDITTLALVRYALQNVYSVSPFIWPCIFTLLRSGIVLAASLLMSSTTAFYSKLRALATSLPSSTWPPSPDSLHAEFVVYLIFSPWHKYFYIGKTVDFQQRVRRHLQGLLYPGNHKPQPYMTFLSTLFRGDRAAAAASLIFLPIAHAPNNADLIELERHIIDTVHPPLNEPYVQRLLDSSGPHSRRRRRFYVFSPPTPPARITQHRRFAQDAPRTLCDDVDTQHGVDTVRWWAAGACNALGSPTSG